MATNQRLSLFVSSKMQELAAERRAIKAALNGYPIDVWLWEDDAGARPEPIQSTYLKQVADCDIYIGLFGHGYGPYTREEYEQARATAYNKYCLIYEKRVDHQHRDPRLTAFLKALNEVSSPKGLTVCSFDTSEQLAAFVQRDVMRLLIEKFRESRQQLPYDNVSPLLRDNYRSEQSSATTQQPDGPAEDAFPTHFKPSQLRTLKGIIKGVHWSSPLLLSAYKASAPPDWLPLAGYEEDETCLIMIDQLANALSQSDDSVPLFTFVGCLARYLDQLSLLDKIKLRSFSLSRMLRNWIKDTAKDQKIPSSALGMVKTTLAPLSLAKGSHYFLIKIEIRDHDPILCKVQAWLLNSQYEEIEMLYATEEAVPLTGVVSILDECYRKVSYHLMNIPEAMKRLTVEFSLPRELLCHDVDHWPITIGAKTRIKVGIQHRTVVRLQERAYNRLQWPLWKDKSESYRRYLKDKTSFPSLVCDAQDCERAESFYTNIMDILCLALTMMPPDMVPGKRDLLDTVFDAGIPIALWPGKHAHIDHTTPEWFNNLLSGCDLSELPTKIQEQRRMAAKVDTEDTRPLGHSITLLWDNAYQLPPDAYYDYSRRLAPPEQPQKGRA